MPKSPVRFLVHEPIEDVRSFVQSLGLSKDDAELLLEQYNFLEDKIDAKVGEKEELKKELEAGFDKELLAESTAWRVRYDNLEVRHAERDKQQRERLKRQEDEIARLMEKNAALEKRLDPESAATTKSKAGMNTEGSQPRRRPSPERFKFMDPTQSELDRIMK